MSPGKVIGDQTTAFQEEHRDTQIVAVYCLCDDLLKSLYYPDDPQCQMSDAEVMTTAIVSSLLFGGKYEKARQFLQEAGYMPHLLSKSRFNRRWHRSVDLFWSLFHLLGEILKQLNERSIYVIDSFPVAVCDNYRITSTQVNLHH